MDQAHVNTEDFIAQIELHPEIWNIAHEDYNNKITRKAAWEDIVKKHAPNFDEQDPIVMNDVVLRFQRKWKNLRDCFTRELQRKRKEKSGRAFRKQYVYFNNLSFLQSTLKMAPSAIPEEDTSQDFQETNIKEEIIQAPQVTEALEEAETPEETSVFEKKRPAKTKRKETSEEDELYAMLKEKVMKHSKEEDEDKLFMLSLVPELKKIPDSLKLDIKVELLSVFKRARLHFDPLNVNSESPREELRSVSPQYVNSFDESPHTSNSQPINEMEMSEDVDFKISTEDQYDVSL